MKNCTHFPFFIDGFQSDMAKSALRKNIFSTLLLLGAMLVSGGAWGQGIWNIPSNAGAWLTNGNWTPSGVPISSGIAHFDANPILSPYNVGINMNGVTNNGTNAQIVGAIEVTNGRSKPLVIGNSSTSANGTLTLNGVSVNSVLNVVLRNNSSSLLTLQNVAGSGNKTMGVALGNGTDNIINIDGTGGITISSIVSGNNLTKSGFGSGVLTLSGANTYSGGTVITSGTLSLGAAGVLADAGTITLSGGTLRTGASTGFSETVGTLSLTSSSTIALGTGIHTLTFANSSGVSWTSGQTLTITGWTGTAGSSGTAGKIIVGAGGLTSTQLAQVSFSGYSAGGAIVAGELVPASTTPTLTVSPTSLTGFTYVQGSGPSTSQSYSLSGTNLTGAPGNITVSASTNYEVSTDNSTFSSTSVTVAYTSATLGATPVYVRLKAGLTAGSYNSELVANAGGGATTKNVTCSGTVTSPPTITVTPTSLTGFTYVQGSGPSTSQSYSLSGANLTGFPGNITVTAPTDYEVSKTNTTFFSSVTVAYTSATLASTTIYVRLKAGLSTGSYNGELVTNAGGGATTQNVTCDGSVTAPPPTLTVSPTSLSGFTYIVGNGPSTSQSYNLSGANLTGFPGNITITGSTNYEVSTDNASFSGSVTVAYTSATLAATPIYVRLKAGLGVGSYNSEIIANAGGGATTQNVTSSGTVTGVPTLTVTPTSLTGFTYVQGSGPSASQSYSLSGANLTGAPGNITVTAPTDYEVSKTNTTFFSSVTVAYSSATLASTTIYVRLKAGLSTGSYNGELVTNAGGGATTQNVSCDGSVTAPPPTLSVSPTSLSGFTYIVGNGPSTSQSYNLSGANLTGFPDNITVTGSTNYEVSTDNASFSGSVTVAYTSATLSATPIYVRLKAGLSVGSYNGETIANAGGGATTQNVTCNGSVANTPTLTVTPTSLTGFTYVQGSGPSTAQSYSLSGTALSPASGNLTITGSTDYEVSLSSSSGFGASVTKSYTGGALSSTLIYVRLKAGLSTGSYNGELVTNAGGGATTQNVTCDGSVSAPPPVLTVSPTTLTGFTYFQGNGPSNAQSYNLSGANLTGFPDNITVTGSTNYEVSTDNVSFSGSVTVAYTSATLAVTPIYVRLKAGLGSGSYNSEIIANAGGGATTKNVTCSGSVTISSATTITAGAGAEPLSISSVSNTQGGAVQNFDINITDDGGSGGDALSTLISQMVFTQGTGNDVANWTLAIAGAELSDGTNSITGTIASSTITFAGISTADLGLVADNATKNYTLKVWLKSDLTTLKTTIDGLNLDFKIQNTNITTNASGSSMATGQSQSSGATNNAIDVQATTLAFVQNTSNTTVSVVMSPAPTVSANDANGNRDLGYVTAVSITSTGTLTGSPVSSTPSSGLATFSTLTHTAAGTGLVLTAASGSLSNAISNTFTINDVTLASDYFRSLTTGNGATNTNWESSHDNSTWITATTGFAPTFAANTVTIRSGHTITVAASATEDQIVIQSGGTLSIGTSLTVNNGTGDDISIENGGIVIYTGLPTFNTSSTMRVMNGGVLSLQASGTTGSTSVVHTATTYDDGSILEFNVSSALASSSNITFFPNASASTIPVFRITAISTGGYGAGTPTTVNGLLEVNSTFNIANAGVKTFRNGISGSAAITQQALCGQFVINGTSATLTGSGVLTLSSTNGLLVNSGATFTADKVIAGTGPLDKQGSGTLTLSGANTYTGGTTITGGTLQLGAVGVLANTGAIILSSGTLSTGATSGFTEQVGTLKLTASSTIALGTGVHTLTFANSSGVAWTAGQTLIITGWTGTAGASGTSGKIVVGTGGLTTAQLAQVSFTGYTAGAAIVSGELVPVAVTPSIAISAAHPTASNFAQGSTNNIVAGFKLVVTNNDATLTSVGVNTSGSYQTSDIQTNGFKFWINSTNDLSGATQLGSNQAVVASGGAVTVSGLSQVITSGTTQYILFTADIAAGAVNGRTIGVTTTAFTKFTFSAGNKTGTDPVPAPVASSLPIKLINFTATRQNNQTQLTFSTATEENNAFFAIERSSNGIDFREIGKVNGAGTTTSIQNYSFTDETPMSGINYYRLKQVDFDGQFTYSPVATVVFDNKAGIRLAPTPVQDQLRVELDEMFLEDANWQMYDFAGRLVKTGVLSAENTVFNVEVGNLTPGNYVIRVVSGQTTLTKQFQK